MPSWCFEAISGYLVISETNRTSRGVPNYSSDRISTSPLIRSMFLIPKTAVSRLYTQSSLMCLPQAGCAVLFVIRTTSFRCLIPFVATVTVYCIPLIKHRAVLLQDGTRSYQDEQGQRGEGRRYFLRNRDSRHRELPRHSGNLNLIAKIYFSSHFGSYTLKTEAASCIETLTCA